MYFHYDERCWSFVISVELKVDSRLSFFMKLVASKDRDDLQGGIDHGKVELYIKTLIDY